METLPTCSCTTTTNAETIESTVVKTKTNPVAGIVEPHFHFDDLCLDDVRADAKHSAFYVDPYHTLRRPIEPERLQRIYQQAFIYDLIYGFAREHLVDQAKQLKSEQPPQQHQEREQPHATNKTTDTTVDSIKDKVLEFLFKRQASEAKCEDDSRIERPELAPAPPAAAINIWTETDLTKLRKHFAEIKASNMSLRSRLIAYEEENKQLHASLTELKTRTHTLPSQVHTLEADNERLYIRVRDLEGRYEAYARELATLEKQMNTSEKERTQLARRTEQLAVDNRRLVYELQKMHGALEQESTKLRLEHEQRAESVQLQHERERCRLKREIANLLAKQCLEAEKHERDLKALEQLRRHFGNVADVLPNRSGGSGVQRSSDRIADNKIAAF